MYPTSLRPALLDYASHFRAADLGGREGRVRGADVLDPLSAQLMPISNNAIEQSRFHKVGCNHRLNPHHQ